MSSGPADLAYAFEPIDALREDGLEEMLVRHWNEVGLDRDKVPLAMDWGRIYREEAAGKIKALSCRQHGNLVGYNAFIVNTSFHYRDTVLALNDAVFIEPKQRGEAGLRLILEAEKGLREMGVVKVFYHSKVDAILGRGVGDSLDFHEFGFIAEDYGVEIRPPKTTARGTLGDVLYMLGYRLEETVHSKVL